MKSHLIKAPIITEKSMALANSENTYTFHVAMEATKPQIASAVEELFEVTVENVRTMVRPRPRRRTPRMRRPVQESVTKKALVTLAEGESIALFDVGGTE
jgi:large subunit ribosomal protein L23